MEIIFTSVLNYIYNCFNFKKTIIIFVSLCFANAYSQVTTNSGSGLSPTYFTLEDAITALNTIGTATSPVVITLTANEAAPLGGFVMTATGTSTNTITINGAGFSIITPVQNAGVYTDGGIKFYGSDYITIQNLTINASSGVAGTTANTATEFPIAFLAATTSNGCSNNTVNNCTIQGTTVPYQNSFGVFFGCTFTTASTSGGNAQTAIDSFGTNNYNTISNSTFSNVVCGVQFVTPNITSTVQQRGNQVNNNTFTLNNFIATSTASYQNMSTTARTAAVDMRNCGVNFTFNDNIININNSTAINTICAGFISTYSTAPTNTQGENNFHRNNVNITNTGVGSSSHSFGIVENSSYTTTTPAGGNYIDLNHYANDNKISISTNSSVANSSSTSGISLGTSAKNTRANRNKITFDFVQTGTGTRTGSHYLLVVGTNNVNNSSDTVECTFDTLIVTSSILNNSSTGTIAGLNIRGNGVGNLICKNNNIDINFTKSTGLHYGILNTSVNNSNVSIIDSNILKMNIDGTSGTLYGIASTLVSSPIVKYSVNYNEVTLTSLATAYTGLAVAMSLGSNNSTTTDMEVNYNKIFHRIGTTNSTSGRLIQNTGICTGKSIYKGNYMIYTNPYCTSCFSRGFHIGSSSTGQIIIDSNLIDSALLMGTGITGTSIGTFEGVFISTSSSNVLIKNNTFRNFLAGAHTGSIVFRGVYLGGTSPSVKYNRFYNFISNHSGSLGQIVGVMAALNLSLSDTIANNIISRFEAPNNTNTGRLFQGINLNFDINHEVYNNSIVFGMPTQITSNTGYVGVQTSNLGLLNLRNNLLYLNIVTNTNPALSSAFAINVTSNPGVHPGSMASTSNNNHYYVPLATNSFLYSQGTDNTTAINKYNLTTDPNFNTSCGLYKSISQGKELATVTDNLTLIENPEGVWTPTGTTLAESGGNTVVGFEKDFNNVLRTSPSDIGAIEFAGTLATQDLLPPTITTNNIHISCISGANISANISDVSGINTTTNKPRLYFKKSTELNEYNANNSTVDGWKYVEASNTTSPFIFNIDFSLLNSTVNANDLVDYFVIAQDNSTSQNVATSIFTPFNNFCITSTSIPAAAFPGTSFNNFKINQEDSIKAFANPNPVCLNNLDSIYCEVSRPSSVDFLIGTPTNSSTYSNPYYSLWSNIHTQHLIKGSDLKAFGIVKGYINSVALDVTTVGTLPMIDLSLKIGNTSLQNLSTSFVDATSFPIAYTNPSLMPSAGFGTVLNFSIPFYWDGESNIVLDFCHGNSASSATMSRTINARTVGYVATRKTHISGATGAATICSDTTSNILSYSVLPTFRFNAQSKITNDITFEWKDTTGAIISTNDSFVNSNMSFFSNTVDTMKYIIKATSSNGCIITDTLKIEKNTIPLEITNATSSTIMPCTGDSVSFNTVTTGGCIPYTYSYYFTPTGLPASPITLSNSNSHLPTSNGSYTVIVTDNANSKDTMYIDTVIIIPAPILVSDTICGMNSAELNATGSGNGQIYWFDKATYGRKVGTGTPFLTPALNAQTIYFAAEGSYIPNSINANQIGTTFTSSGAFTGSYSLKLKVNKPLVVDSIGIHIGTAPPTTNCDITFGVYDSTSNTIANNFLTELDSFTITLPPGLTTGQLFYVPTTLQFTDSTSKVKIIRPKSTTCPDNSVYRGFTNPNVYSTNSNISSALSIVGTATTIWNNLNSTTHQSPIVGIKYSTFCGSKLNPDTVYYASPPVLDLNYDTFQICDKVTNSTTGGILKLNNPASNFENYFISPLLTTGSTLVITGNEISGWDFNNTVNELAILTAYNTIANNCSISDTILVKSTPFFASSNINLIEDTVCYNNTDTLEIILTTSNTPIYCSPFGATITQNAADEEILGVQLGSLDNNTSCTVQFAGSQGTGIGSTNYTDFTTSTVPIPKLSKSITYSAVVNNGTCGASNFNNRTAIFIDWNQDGDFSDANEVFQDNGTISGANIDNFNINVPNDALLGKTRMRVILRETTLDLNGCTSITGTYYGEVEEYTIEVTDTNYKYAWYSDSTGNTVLGTNDSIFPTISTSLNKYLTVIKYGLCTDTITSLDVIGIPIPGKIKDTSFAKCGVGPNVNLKFRDSANASNLPNIIYNWYDAVGSTIALQSSTDNFYNGSTAVGLDTFYVSAINILKGCEGAREMVIFNTTNSTDDIYAFINGIQDTVRVCEGSILNLTATTGPGNTYTNFTWSSPDVNSGANPSLIGGSQILIPSFGNYTYTLSSTAGICNASKSVVVLVQRNNFIDYAQPQISAIDTHICLGANANLQLLPLLFQNVPPTNYPITTGATSTNDEDIIGVNLLNLNNITSCLNKSTGSQGIGIKPGATEYYDFTNAVPIPALYIDSNYSVIVKIGTCGGNFLNHTNVFIDWNQNGVFTDVGENFFKDTVRGPHSDTISIIVPSTALKGKTRMRIVNIESSTLTHNSNTTFTWGETEDYYINVIPNLNLNYSWLSDSTASTILGTGDTLINPLNFSTNKFMLLINEGYCYTSAEIDIDTLVTPLTSNLSTSNIDLTVCDTFKTNGFAIGGCKIDLNPLNYIYKWSAKYGSIVGVDNDTNVVYINNVSPNGTIDSLKLIVEDNRGNKDSSFVSINILSAVIDSVKHDTICGLNTATLNIYNSTNSETYWFTSLEDSLNFLSNTNTYTTPPLTANDTFYVQSSTTTSFAKLGSDSSSLTITSTTYGGVMLTVNTTISLDTFDVYSLGGSLFGYQLFKNGSSTPIYVSPMYPTTVGASGAPIATSIPCNLVLTPGVYRFLRNPLSVGNFGVSKTATTLYNHPSSFSSYATLNGSISSLTATPSTTYNYYFYKVKVSKPCFSPKVPVIGYYIAPPVGILSLHKDTICNDTTTGLVTFSNTASFDMYTWNPLNGGSIPVGDISTTGVQFSEMFKKNYTYELVASQSSGLNCIVKDTFTLDNRRIPNNSIITTSLNDLCNGQISKINATSGNIIYSQIGTGTATNLSTGYPSVGINRSSVFQNRLQILYTASELTTAGFTAGPITSIAFDIANLPDPTTVNDYNISIAPTTNTIMTSAFINTGLEQVYSGNYTPELGFKEIPFNNSFIWDGTSNLIIDIKSKGQNGTANTRNKNSTTTGVYTVYTNSSTDNANYFNTQLTGITTISRPNIRFYNNTKANTTFSPTTSLFINSNATAPYTSTIIDSVWAKPSDTSTIYINYSLDNFCYESDSVTINVTDTITITTNVSKTVNLCQSDSFGSSILATSTSPITYQWKKWDGTTFVNTTVGTGSTNDTFSISNVSLSDSGKYIVEMTTGGPCGMKYSDTITLSIGAKILISQQPNVNGTQTICGSGTATISTSASNDVGKTWYKIQGAGAPAVVFGSLDTNTFSPLATDSGRYFAVLTATAPCMDVNTDTVQLNVINTAIVTSVAGSDTVCKLGSLTLSGVTVDAASGYAWLKDGVAVVADANHTITNTGTTGSTLAITNATSADNGSYKLVAIAGGACPNDTSNDSLRVLVNDSATVSVTVPASACQGTKVKMTSTYTNAIGFLWNKDAAATTNTTDSLIIASAASTDAGSYSLVVTAKEGCPNVTSTASALAVIPAAIATSVAGSDTVCKLGNLTLSGVTTDATGYTWLKDGVAVVADANHTITTTGTTGSTLAITNATSADNGVYKLIAISAGGCINDTSNDSLRVLVNDSATVSVTVPASACQGTKVTMTSTYTNSIGFAWNKDAAATGTITDSLIIASAASTDAGSYSLVVTAKEGCPNVTSTASALAVIPASVATSVAGSDTVCKLGSLTLSGVTTDATGYTWIKDGVAVVADANHTITTTGATGSTLAITNATSTDNGVYKLIAISAGGCINDTSNDSLRVLVNDSATVSVTVPASACQGTKVTMTSTYTNSIGFAWNKDAAATGTITDSLIIASAASTDAGSYSLVVTAKEGCPNVTSTASALAVIPAAIATSVAGSDTVCKLGSLTLSGVTTDATGYTWLKDGVAVVADANHTITTTGTTGSTLAITNATSTDNGVYKLVALTGGSCPSDTSNDSLRVLVNDSATVSVTVPASACQGTKVTMTSTYTNAIGFLWNKDAAATGTITDSLIIASAASTDAGSYSLVVTAKEGCPNVTSTASALAVIPAAVATSVAGSDTVCKLGSLTLSGVTTDATGYTWLKDGVAVVADANHTITTTGATGSTLAITNATSTDNGVYKLVALTGGSCPSDTSNDSLRVLVNEPLSLSAPTANTTLCQGNTYTNSVTITGTGLVSYQWFDGSSTLVSSGTGSPATLSTTAIANNTYTMVASTTSGCPNVTSSVATLTVNTAPSKPIVAGANSIADGVDTICTGGSTSLTTTGTNNAGYVWTKGSTQVSTSANYTATTSGIYTITAKGNTGCSDSSVTFEVKETTPAAITVQPVSLTNLQAGQNTTLRVTATNASSYQWYKDGVLMGGETKDSLVITNFDSATHAGKYTVEVTGILPCTNVILSNESKIESQTCPMFTTQPLADTVCEGGSVVLTATASTTSGYEWYKGTSKVSSNQTYTISNATASKAGWYKAKALPISGVVCPNVFSDSVYISVDSKIKITSQPQPINTCNATSHTMSVTATGTSLSYQWYKDGLLEVDSINPTYTITNLNTVPESYYVEVTSSGPCPAAVSDTVEIKNRKVSEMVVLNDATYMDLVEQCTDSLGWTYYSRSNVPEELLFAIRKNGNTATFAPDLEINNKGVHWISHNNNRERIGSVIGSRMFNVDLVSGSIQYPYDVRFFFSPSDTTAINTEIEDKATANNPGKVKMLHNNISMLTSTLVPFTSTLLSKATSMPLNFYNTIVVRSSYGKINGVSHVDIYNLVAENGGGSMYKDYKVNNTSGIEINVNKGMGVSIYPVPANTEMTIELTSNTLSPITMTITDMTGRVIEVKEERHQEMTSEHKIDVSSYSTGTYNVSITNGESITSAKFTVDR